MNDVHAIAAKEGVSPADIEIISVTEQQVSETQVVKTITYRLTRRGLFTLANRFLVKNQVTDGRAIQQFYVHMTANAQPEATAHELFSDKLQSGFVDALELVRNSGIPLQPPAWFSDIAWSKPIAVQDIPLLSPSLFCSGAYIFLIDFKEELEVINFVPQWNIVWASTSRSLRKDVRRIRSIVRNRTTAVTASEVALHETFKHLATSDRKLLVQWACCPIDPQLDNRLIEYLSPILQRNQGT